jgi:hypothetical protein
MGFANAQPILQSYYALKEIIADQIKAAMNAEHITKTAMAARMHEPPSIGSPARSSQSFRDAHHIAAGGNGSGKDAESGVGVKKVCAREVRCEYSHGTFSLGYHFAHPSSAC